MKIKLLLFYLFFFCVSASFGAEKDSVKAASTSSYNYSKAPSIGYSIGYLNLFGDVKLKGYSPSFASRLGHQFYVAFPISESFSVSYNFIAGKIIGEETRGTDNLNFRTSLVGQSLMFEYNFYNIIKPDYESKFGVLPVIGFGIEALIFRAKADMEDADGNKYYYWNDGTIKNLPETSENLDLAVDIERDYTYETELRDANLDGFGKYSQITFAMPFTFGADFKVGRNLHFRLGATYHLTFSDMLDNVSSKGSGNRQGEEGKDMFLFSSLGINYKFGAPRSKKSKQPDTDEDGIADIFDKCRETPKGVKVDKNGCPQVNEKDRDGDGVLDVVDRCRDTKTGDAVDKEGCSAAQKEEQKKQAQLADSIAAVKAAQEAEAKKQGDFYFADLNKNGRVEVQEVNDFIDRLFDGDKSVTIPIMEEIIDYYFDQEPVSEAKPEETKIAEENFQKIITNTDKQSQPEKEIKPAEVKPETQAVKSDNINVTEGIQEAEPKPVEAKGKLIVEPKPLDTKNLDSKYHFADLNKNGKIEKVELDVFIDRMEKGDKSVPIKLIDEILIYYFNQE
ncbi:MAG: hypothetical protein POELPBGB_03867 [Bacteroidia bacterium]|nr:hypothetical protein [Bacteroidia bacterium]